MKYTISVKGTYTLCYAYDAYRGFDFYDVYDETGSWIGELPASYVNNNLIDETTEEYDEEGLAILIEDLFY